jgi:hypothetical protein
MMDFNQLMMKMRELDQSTTEGGCGMDSPMSPPPLSAVPPKPDVPPPSMSVNINAQGLDNIEDMMKLFTKVNPDMMPIDKPSMPPIPSLGAPPSIMSIKPSLPPLKMLPDFDADNDDKIGGDMDSDYNDDGKLDRHEKDHAAEKPLLKSLDLDKDGDHDMDDHDKEKKSKEEEYANEPDTDIKDVDYMNNKLAGGMNRPKDTFPKVSDGDNPMKKNRFESGDLRSQIRAELLQRLAEAKGAK